MEGRRQRRAWLKRKRPTGRKETEKRKKHLTLTGLLMEGVGLSSLGMRKFSILLDTRALEEQYQFEVSLFEAKLPLLSPFAVSLKDRLRIERQQGRTNQVLFYSLARGPTSCSTYRFAHPRRQRFQATSLKPHLLHASRKFVFFKKEIHHV
jgi:hypothetical protein